MSGPILIFTKTDQWSINAINVAESLFPGQIISFNETTESKDRFPVVPDHSEFTAVISYLSPWIVPDRIIKKSNFSINFHPASREYPGTGCYNFALYEEASEYGAVCHHMHARVDTGPIIREVRFPIYSQDSVESLKLRTMVAMLALYQEIMIALRHGRRLPAAERSWSRRPFTRRELNELKVITPDMQPDEIRRRVRATTYPGYPGASLRLAGITFQTEVSSRLPLA
jgi:methionyl-tRNA formyltransferase